jgi:hypothetical protein
MKVPYVADPPPTSGPEEQAIVDRMVPLISAEDWSQVSRRARAGGPPRRAGAGAAPAPPPRPPGPAGGGARPCEHEGGQEGDEKRYERSERHNPGLGSRIGGEGVPL